MSSIYLIFILFDFILFGLFVFTGRFFSVVFCYPRHDNIHHTVEPRYLIKFRAPVIDIIKLL
ncbi:hypothetical protein BDV30DRAFT_206380, partial [Aspergillus minisclerotigenes]